MRANLAVETAIQALKNGRMVLLTDARNRENEADSVVKSVCRAATFTGTGPPPPSHYAC